MHRRAALAAIAALALASVADGAEKTEKKKGGGDSFIQLPTIAVTVRRLGGGNGVMTIDVGIDVADGGLRHRAEQSTPLLRDAYLREMLTYAPTLGAGQPPNPDVIGAMLQRATDRALGRPGAKLLLGAILIN
jgi:hypothetical protein